MFIYSFIYSFICLFIYLYIIQDTDLCGFDICPSWLKNDNENNSDDNNYLQIENKDLYDNISSNSKILNKNRNLNRPQMKNKSAPVPGLILIEKVPLNRAVIKSSNLNDDTNNNDIDTRNRITQLTSDWMLTPDPGEIKNDSNIF